MNVLKKIRRTYSSSSIDIREKAPLFMVIMMVLNILAIVLVVGDLVSQEPLSKIMSHLFLYLLVFVSTLGVYSGRFVLVGNVFFIFIELAFFALRISDPFEGGISLSLYAAILGSFLVFGAVFISSRKILFGLCGFYFISYLGYLILVALPAGETFPLTVQDMLYPTIAVTATAFALIITRTIFDRILISHRESILIMQKKEAWARGLAVSSTQQIAKSAALLTNARETSQASLEIEENVHAIDARFNMLYLRMDSALKSLEEVKTSAYEMTNLSKNQLERLELSGSAVDSMVTSINKVSKVIAERAKEIKGLTENALQGAEIVDETEKAFNRVGELVNGIKNLARIISDIAEKTNLLAMNASIQAAHAGEAGKGFAVVAGEVRTLSESTSHSASSIAASIDDLVNAMAGAGGSLGSTKKVFQELTRDINLFGLAIGSIGQNVAELEKGSHEIQESNESLSQISFKVDEQSLTVNTSQQSAFEAIESISLLASQMTDETQDISNGASTISRSMEDIQKLALELEDQSRKLNHEIDGEQG